MFEFHLSDKSIPPEDIAHPDGGAPSPLDVRKVSFLVWNEHCIECAAPDCFDSCDLYAARPDGRCRRFVHGIVPNRNFRGARGPGAEVRFKQWGKLETRGNARLASPRLVGAVERLNQALAPLAQAALRLAARVTGDRRLRWGLYTALERLVRLIQSGSERSALPHAFLAEIYNPMATAVTAQLTFSADRARIRTAVAASALPVSYVKRLEIPPGYFRVEIPMKEIERVVGSGLRFSVSFTPNDASETRLVFLTLDFVQFAPGHDLVRDAATAPPARGISNSAPPVKCVVFDLDHTLWDGVLLESDDVRVRSEVVDLMKYLDSRGIVLAIASKNAYEHAWAKIVEFGLDQYFVCARINWLPKSENVKAIAEVLNIGLDTFAFVDDNPFERAEVAAALPMVECRDVIDVAKLPAEPRYRGSDSAESKMRRRFYQEAAARAEEEAAFKGDYVEFLRASAIVLEVRRYEEPDFERAAELVQRTNQLNFSGHKYTRDEVRGLVDDPSRDKYVLSVADRFGSYGVVGFCLVRPGQHEVTVEDFMLSCRVQGKFVEQALFAHLIALNSHPPERLRVKFKPTARNEPARQVLQALGMDFEAEPGSCVLDVVLHPLSCDFIEVRSVDPIAPSRPTRRVPVPS